MADPLKQFIIQPWIPLEIGGLNLSYTNSSFWMTVGVLVSLLFLTAATSRRAVIPSRAQIFAEILYEFVADMIRTNTGTKGMKFFPFVFTLFILVLMGNLLGMIPFSFTYTSSIIVTTALALLVFFAVTIFGILNHGVKFLQLFCPSGVPLWLAPLIIPIEVISYLSRPVTLSLRLFINMMVGHLLLKVIAGFSVSLMAFGLVGFLGAFGPVIINVLMIAFEIFIALIQAYVFTLLTCMYLKDAVELHH